MFEFIFIQLDYFIPLPHLILYLLNLYRHLFHGFYQFLLVNRPFILKIEVLQLVMFVLFFNLTNPLHKEGSLMLPVFNHLKTCFQTFKILV